MGAIINHEPSSLDAACRGEKTRSTILPTNLETNSAAATIETSHPLFVIHTNRVTTLPDTSLFALCQKIYDSALQNLSLTPYSHLLSLQSILTATFDPTHRAFVLDDSPDTQRILAVLDADARACIFAQAIAGMVHFLRSVAECTSPLNKERIDAKLRRFADSEARHVMLEAVETSPVWTDCFEKAQISDLILKAVTGQNNVDVVSEKNKEDTAVSVVELGDDLVNEPVFNDGPHLKRDLGVPDVFTIMVLN